MTPSGGDVRELLDEIAARWLPLCTPPPETRDTIYIDPVYAADVVRSVAALRAVLDECAGWAEYPHKKVDYQAIGAYIEGAISSALSGGGATPEGGGKADA